jgi:hypothetical protein
MATVCALAVGGVTLARAAGIHLTCRQQSRTICFLRAQRSSLTPLPWFLVLRIGLVAGGITSGASCLRGLRLVLGHRGSRKPSAVLKAARVELQGAGILGDDADLVVGVAVLFLRGDLHADLQVGVICCQVLDDLLGELG